MVLDGQRIEKLLPDHLPMLGQGPTYKGLFAYTRVGRERNIMLVTKAFHIIAMVAWFSGIFYLPRLFVYHSEAGIKSVLSVSKLWSVAFIMALLGQRHYSLRH